MYLMHNTQHVLQYGCMLYIIMKSTSHLFYIMYLMKYFRILISSGDNIAELSSNVNSFSIGRYGIQSYPNYLL